MVISKLLWSYWDEHVITIANILVVFTHKFVIESCFWSTKLMTVWAKIWAEFDCNFSKEKINLCVCCVNPRSLRQRGRTNNHLLTSTRWKWVVGIAQSFSAPGPWSDFFHRRSCSWHSLRCCMSQSCFWRNDSAFNLRQSLPVPRVSDRLCGHRRFWDTVPHCSLSYTLQLLCGLVP